MQINKNKIKQKKKVKKDKMPTLSKGPTSVKVWPMVVATPCKWHRLSPDP